MEAVKFKFLTFYMNKSNICASGDLKECLKKLQKRQPGESAQTENCRKSKLVLKLDGKL